MHVSVAAAKAQLTELVRRAEAGDEVVLTRDGQPAVRLVPATKATSAEQRWRLLEDLRGSATNRFGPDAAHSADFLYDDFGLPA